MLLKRRLRHTAITRYFILPCIWKFQRLRWQVLSLMRNVVWAIIGIFQRYTFFRHFMQFLFRQCFSIQIKGEEFLTRKEGVILVGNHAGWLDPPLVIAFFDHSVRWLVNPNVFSSPFLGWIAKKTYGIPLYRNKGTQALAQAGDELKRGNVIGIFAEGKGTLDGKISPFRSGAARLHLQSGAPIIPFVIHGNFEAWPGIRLIPRPRRVILQFGQPIEKWTGTPKSLMEELYQQVVRMKAFLEQREKAS